MNEDQNNDNIPFDEELAKMLKHLKNLSSLPKISGDGYIGKMQYVSNHISNQWHKYLEVKNAIVSREGGTTFYPIKDLDEITQKKLLVYLQENDAIDLDMRYYMPPIPNPLFIINPEKFEELYKKYAEPNRKVSAGFITKDKASGQFFWDNKPIKLKTKNLAYTLLDALVSRGLNQLVSYKEIDKHFRSKGFLEIDDEKKRIKRIHNTRKALLTQARVDGIKLSQVIGVNEFIEVEDGKGLKLVG